MCCSALPRIKALCERCHVTGVVSIYVATGQTADVSLSRTERRKDLLMAVMALFAKWEGVWKMAQ